MMEKTFGILFMWLLAAAFGGVGYSAGTAGYPFWSSVCYGLSGLWVAASITGLFVEE